MKTVRSWVFASMFAYTIVAMATYHWTKRIFSLYDVAAGNAYHIAVIMGIVVAATFMLDRIRTKTKPWHGLFMQLIIYSVFFPLALMIVCRINR